MKTEKEDLTGQMNLFEMLSGDTDQTEQPGQDYKEKEKEPQLMQYKGAKLAVDRYMEIVERLREDEMLIEDEGELVLCDV